MALFLKIFFLALLARLSILGWLLYHGGEKLLILGDTTRYLGLARGLVNNLSYSFANGLPDAYRPPGYPLYLAFFEYFNLPLWTASLIQIIVASLIPLFIFWFARHLKTPPWVPTAAAIAAAIEPVQAYYSVVLLPDAFFTIILFTTLLLLARWLNNQKYFSPLAVAGIMLGLANYFRPAGLYLAIFLAILLFFLKKKSDFLRKSDFLSQIIGFALISWAIIIPWQLRNFITFGDPSFVSSSAVNFYTYGAAFSIAIAEDKEYDAMRKQLRNEIFPQQAPEPRDINNLKNKKFLINYTFNIIKKYPLAYLKSYALGINTVFFSGDYHNLLLRQKLISPPSSRPSFSLILARDGFLALASKILVLAKTPYFLLALGGKILWLFLFLGSLFGAWLQRHSPVAWLYLLLVFYFCFTLLSVTMGVEPRHRYALNPLIFTFFFATMPWIRELYDKIIRYRSAV